MLRLGQQIGGDMPGIVGRVGDDQDFRRPGDHVDSDRAENLPLGLGDIGVAGAGDFIDRRHARRSVGKRGNRLRSADTVNFTHARDIRRRQNRGIDLSLGRGHRHRHARHPGDARRNRIHQHRTRISRQAARNINAYGIHRRPSRAERHALLIDIAEIGRQAAAMESVDTAGREFEGGEQFRAALFFRRRDLRRADAQIVRIHRKFIETLRIFKQREIAPDANIAHNSGDDIANVGRSLALDADQRLEPGGEIRVGAMQQDGHGRCLQNGRSRGATARRRS